MEIEQLESRTLLSSTPWGETLYQGRVGDVEVLSGGDVLVVGNELAGGTAVLSAISRISPDGTLIWQIGLDLLLGDASVATSGETDVIWISAAEGTEGRLLRVSPDGTIEMFAQSTGEVAALSDGRVAFVSGYPDATLMFMEADGDVQTFSADLSEFKVTDMAADAEDNVFVIGYTSEPNPANTSGSSDDDLLFDGIIRKYDPFGTLLWQRRYDVGDSNEFGAVDVDPAGNAWIAAKIAPQGWNLPSAPDGATVPAPAYFRAISYTADGLLSASPIIYAADSHELDSRSLDITAAEGRAVVKFEVGSNPSTSILVGVQGEDILWRSAVKDETIFNPILAPDGTLLFTRFGSDADTLVRVDEYRQGDTLFVPGTDEDDVITVVVKGERVVARRGEDRIITYVDGLTDISVGLAQGNDSLNAAVPFDIDARGGLGDDTIITGHGQDTLRGGEGHDRIESHGNADSLVGGRGADILFGGAGNDTISGGGDIDLLYGEGGNDNLVGDGGNDTLDCGDGDDRVSSDISLVFDDGDDLVLGGAGNDVLIEGGGKDSLVGGAGDDMLTAFGEESTVRGGAGNDSIHVGWLEMATVHGGRGADDITTGGANQVVYGGPDRDLFTSVSPDVIKDLEPDDRVTVSTPS